MSDHTEGRTPAKKPEPTEADKAALEPGAPNWDRMDQIADRLLSTPPSPDRQSAGKVVARKQRTRKA